MSAQILRYLFMLVLSWLLLPEEFGLIGLGFIVIDLLVKVGELGLAAALVQRKSISDGLISTAFWANLTANMILGAIVVAFSSAIAGFMNEPDVRPVLIGLAVLFPIQSLILIPRTMLQRELRLDRLAQADVVGEIAFGVVGIVVALLSGAVWSLIAASIVRQLVRSLILSASYRWTPRLQFDNESFRELSRFGFPVMGSAIFSQSIAKLDYFLIGRFLGAETLGYYTLAFQLAVLPTQHLANVLHRVAFPSFSKIQDSVERLHRGYCQLIEMFVMLLAPIAFGWMLFADLIIGIFYSDVWLPVVPAIRILAIAGLLYCFDTVVDVFYALGRADLRLKMLLIRFVLLVMFLYWFGLDYGIEGVAWSVSIAALVSTPVVLHFYYKLTDSNWSEMFRTVSAPLLAAFFAALIVYWIRRLYFPGSSLGDLMLLASLFGFVYVTPLTLNYRQRIPFVLRRIKSLVDGKDHATII